MNTESEVSKVLVDSLIAIENVILEKYKPPKDEKAKEDYDIDHAEKYFHILYQIQTGKEKINSINFKNMNDKLKRLDEDELKRVNNNINQHFKNMVLYGIIMLVCGILIILISIDSPVSYGILGIIISGSLFMLYINYVKYFDNKSYKSRLDIRADKGEDDAKIMREFN